MKLEDIKIQRKRVRLKITFFQVEGNDTWFGYIKCLGCRFAKSVKARNKMLASFEAGKVRCLKCNK